MKENRETVGLCICLHAALTVTGERYEIHRSASRKPIQTPTCPGPRRSRKWQRAKAIYPVCGMTVMVKPDTRTEAFGGKDFHFCSSKYQAKFRPIRG